MSLNLVSRDRVGQHSARCVCLQFSVDLQQCLLTVWKGARSETPEFNATKKKLEKGSKVLPLTKQGTPMILIDREPHSKDTNNNRVPSFMLAPKIESWSGDDGGIFFLTILMFNLS